MTDRQGRFNDELWESSNPRFGTVRAVMFANDFAGALDDTNGDYREISLDLYRRGPDGWLLIASIDDVGYPGVGEAGGEGWVAGVAYVFGRDKPNNTGTVLLLGQTYTIHADADGWWLVARDAWNDDARPL